MKIQKFALAALCLSLSFLPSCSEAGVDAKGMADKAKGAVADMDFSALSGEALADKAKELTSGLGESLASAKDSITDAASAEKWKEKAGPMIEGLSKVKTMLGDKMPSLDVVKDAFTGLKDKFAGQEGIMKVIQPLIDKLQAMFA